MNTFTTKNIVLTTFMLLCYYCCAMAGTETATINRFWLEEAVVNGQRGLKAHVDFNVYGMQGKKLNMVMNFYDEVGSPWAGTYKNKYCDGYSSVIRVADEITPRYSNSHVGNATLFIPWNYLQFKRGRHLYYCQITIGSWYASSGYMLAQTGFASFYGTGNGGSSGFSYADYESRMYANSSSSYRSNSKKSSVSAVDAALTLGTVAAAGYSLYKLFTGDNSSSSSSTTKKTYYTKKYSDKELARLLYSDNLYACRFAEEGNLFITRAQVITRNGTQYITLPNYRGGKYELKHSYHSGLKEYVIWMNCDGDSYYLMDKDKNIVVY